MYILDTSLYCAVFLEEDAHHVNALDMISGIDEKIYIPYFVFSETITVLTYRHSKELANEFIDFILSDERFVFINEDLLGEVSFWKGIEKRLSYIDIVLVYTAIKYGAELLSFDDEMNKLFLKLSQ
ncbi:MAG: PIN domain-containing protein [Candidatus Gracilibacteria bacterium]|nr:PIN domain-containing protein [Candidatus Gracilibacteria bacterium]